MTEKIKRRDFLKSAAALVLPPLATSCSKREDRKDNYQSSVNPKPQNEQSKGTYSIKSPHPNSQTSVYTPTTATESSSSDSSNISNLERAVKINQDYMVNGASWHLPDYLAKAEGITKRNIDSIILHMTDTDSDSLQTIINDKSAHFYIRKDGTVFEVVNKKTSRAHHAGKSMWNKQTDLNYNTIGIEVQGKVSHERDTITDAQYSSLKGLVALLRHDYNIPENRVLAHAQVAYSPEGNQWYKGPHRGRREDPGIHFNWEKVGLPNNYNLVDPDVVDKRVLGLDPYTIKTKFNGKCFARYQAPKNLQK